MKDFVYGTEADFQALAATLSDNRCHVYDNCALPVCCSKQRARIGFEKTGEGYYIAYIDKGITSNAGDEAFAQFLARGEARFVDLADMVAFFNSLKPLYEHSGGVGPNPVPPSPGGCAQSPSPQPQMPTYDSDEILRQREENSKPVRLDYNELAKRLKKKVYGQDKAIDEVCKRIALNRMKKDKKLLTMMLLGPTGVGKTEMADALATELTELLNEPYGFIEISGSEFEAEHSIQSFFGAPPSYVGHGQPTKLDPVRHNPRHVIVINEIEKAHRSLITGLMEAIDKGVIGMADNSADINLKECILVFTSNLPVDMRKYNSLDRFEQDKMCKDIFTRHCGRPEISGKIANFIVFDELDDATVMKVVAKFAADVLSDNDIRPVRIEKELMADFLNIDRTYGGRGVRDAVTRSIGYALLEPEVVLNLMGKKVVLKGRIDNVILEEV